MRFALAVLFALHGIAHLVGFAGSWQLAASGELPYKTTVLNGRIDLGDAGIRMFGLLWVAAAIAFVMAAAGILLEADWWVRLAAIVAAGSLVLTVLEWPAARVGLYLNVIILAVLAVLTRLQRA